LIMENGGRIENGEWRMVEELRIDNGEWWRN